MSPDSTEICSLCGREIGGSEKAYVLDGKLVCLECDEKRTSEVVRELQQKAISERKAGHAETAKKIIVNYSKGELSCPSCGRSLKGMTGEMAGDLGVCPKCKTEFVIGSEVDEITEETRDLVHLPKLGMSVKNISLRALYGFVFVGVSKWVLIVMCESEPSKGLSDMVEIFHLLFVVLVLVLLYKIWAIIQLGNVKTGPGAAVALLFLPFYNLYWIFGAFGGWVGHYSRTLTIYNVKKPRMLAFLGLAASAASIAWFVAAVGFIARVSYPESRYYVEREGKYVRVLHQEQVKGQEQVYSGSSGPFLVPSSRFSLPTKRQYFNRRLLRFLPFLYFDIAMMCFFVLAVPCANFLSESHMMVKTGL